MDSSDWPTWKTRFRCALNKLPDIQELKNYGKLDGPEPFRAYRLLSKHGKYNQSLIYSYLGLEQRPPGYKPRDKKAYNYNYNNNWSSSRIYYYLA